MIILTITHLLISEPKTTSSNCFFNFIQLLKTQHLLSEITKKAADLTLKKLEPYFPQNKTVVIIRLSHR